MTRYKIINGDCIEKMAEFPENSIDAIVTDPPYGIGFMGKKRDTFNRKQFYEFSFKWGEQELRVLKLGGWAVIFSGTQTYHRMACGIEDTGFNVSNMLLWMYGSGFSKSLDISQAIDKKLGKFKDRKYLYTEVHSDNTHRFTNVLGE